MNFSDCLTLAVSNIDPDLPDRLLPITIFDNAAMMAHMSSDMVGAHAWN